MTVVHEPSASNATAAEAAESAVEFQEATAALSGLYSWRAGTNAMEAEVFPEGIAEGALTDGAEAALSEPATKLGAPLAKGATGELHLDVDGRYPQMLASGTLRLTLTSKVSWIAKLAKSGKKYTGPIIYKDPPNPASFPYTKVRILVAPGGTPSTRTAAVRFIGPGNANLLLKFTFKSPYFHPVDFEFDSVTGEAPTLSISTCAHPNRPASLPCENLTAQDVFRRAGFRVTTSPGGAVPLSGAGAGAAWSELEMHDAMQVHWSRFSSQARWAMWTLFAALSEDGQSLGGIMFDDIGAQHRQGCAIFNDSFIAQAPPGDPNPAAWVQRMIFWTACHEMGHCFNLAHSWQKSLGTAWIPLADEPLARSFMNYPFRPPNNQSAFFADFAYRFSDQELTFLRHAPSQFVQMGNAAWFDHHGFENADVSPEPTFELELRANRDRMLFEFMEPPRLELKLTNVSAEPQVVDRRVLEMTDSMAAVVKRDGRDAYQLRPYVQRCWQSEKIVLEPQGALYAPLLAATGSRGWTIDEPGRYTVQVGLEIGEEQVVSNPLRLRVAPPRSYEEELLAQEYFTDDVGRVIALQGSRVLERGNDVLREVAEQFGDTRAALHARLALGNSAGRDHKELVPDEESPVGFTVVQQQGDRDTGRELMRSALLDDPDKAVETFGHIGYRTRVDRFSSWLAEHDGQLEAQQSQETLYEALSRHKVNGRGVREDVLEEIRAGQDK
ncbi:MAG: hypothetical protein M3355_08685 [Actinomycetota bacterium]|nr:hypothetical protein [Actinomycetota bacterium]